MNKNQFDLFAQMLRRAGSSIIFASVTILIFTEFTIIKNYSSTFLGIFASLAVAFLICSYYFNYKSSKYAEKLTESLKGSNWLKKNKKKKSS